MPRAKRTNRAEARRRYRASLAEPLDESDEPPSSAPSGRTTAAEAAPRTGERPSLAYAFRAAFRPVNLREDLRYLPKLLVDRSVWLPILLTVAAGVAFAATNGANALIAIVATYFVAPPALGSVFVGGFLAPRASYLVGLIVGFVSAVVASTIILTSSTTTLVSGQPIVSSPSPTPAASAAPSTAASPGASAAPSSPVASAAPSESAPAASATPGASPTPTASPTPRTPSSVQDQIIYAFVTSPPFGLFFAASAAWYRRFLRLSRPTPPRQQQRRSDGKTRTRK